MSLWTEQFIPNNPFSRPGNPLTNERIVIHYTGNPGATAAGHVGYFGNVIANQNPSDPIPDTYASAHLFIDRTEAILIIPLNEIAYHASSANPNSIGIEMCIEQDWSFHPDTVQRTVRIVAELCKQFGLQPGRDLIRHYDVTGKICPKPYVENPQAWEDFKQSVDREMRGGDGSMQLTTEQWGKLAAALDRLYRNSVIGDYTWATKAYTGQLQLDELVMLFDRVSQQLLTKLEETPRQRFIKQTEGEVQGTLLITVVRLPSGALETTLTANTSDWTEKIQHMRDDYDDDFALKTNPDVRVVDYLFV